MEEFGSDKKWPDEITAVTFFLWCFQPHDVMY